MPQRVKPIAANAECPCGRLAKFKHCCRGRVDWDYLRATDSDGVIRNLSTRGKNLAFLNAVSDALQFDSEQPPKSHAQFKRAFTAKAVRAIHEAIADLWPDQADLKRVLLEESTQSSGLYIGMYDPSRVTRGLARHSLYADRILLIDPLMHPLRVKEELNPLAHPEQHRTMTLRWVTLWIALLPWIDDGIVGFVRAPGDLDPELGLACYKVTQQRYDKHPELWALSEAAATQERDSRDYQDFREDLLLRYPDDVLRRQALERDPDLTETDLDSFIADIRRRRDEHPYHLDWVDDGPGGSDLMSMSSGTNYEQAKIIATLSKSHLVTDIAARWREIELDRADSNIDDGAWSPFAKAFHGLPFRFLDDVPLTAALTLRREDRLGGLRGFLRKAWDATAKDHPFDPAAAVSFAGELESHVREAEAEWRAIDTDLLKMVGTFASAAAMSAPNLIASGHAHWLGTAAVLAGGAALLTAQRQRRTYPLRHPAGFFVDLRDGKFDRTTAR